MSNPDTIYKTRTASIEDIFLHLTECKDDFSPPLDQTVNLSEYSKKIAEKAITFEAWIDNRLAGLVAAYFNNLENHSGYITHVGVLRNYKGKGIAFNLMSRCIEFAIQNSFYQIQLEVAEDNDKAIQLYKKLNFVIFEKKEKKARMILQLVNLKNKHNDPST
ncbi:MAG TPA: GNAT family N-acetyltransferase [Chitinophagaceae bacterium]